jgi:predicted metalloprotease
MSDMRWQMGRRSQNIEDRRGMSPAGFGRGARVGGIGGLGLVAVMLIGLFFGVDPGLILNSLPVDPGFSEPPAMEERRAPPGEDQQAAFVSTVLAQTEDTWDAIFAQSGQSYQPPQLVLFSGAVQSACGMAGSATGPFYCPADQKVYLDLSFFEELEQRFGAPGDFAQAYVIAHEVGHHIQTLLGVTSQVDRLRRQVGTGDANQLSVMMELQADCLAGVWARHTEAREQVLEQGDLEEGMRAASAVGDDRIQRRTQGYVVPDAFTHGSSEQRMRWFRVGLESGDVDACDTFNAGRL